MFWKDSFIIKMLGIITSSISKCQYQINGSWHDAQAELISLDRNNAVYSVDIPYETGRNFTQQGYRTVQVSLQAKGQKIL